MMMNQPPEEAILVDHRKLYDFVSTAASTVGLSPDRSQLLADLLVTNDLRGVRSHGTHQIARYAILMRDGELNPDPQIHVVSETPASLLVDGDGGLGYFPAHEGTLRVVDKAAEQGIAVMVSRNHGHFGAAGIYSRLGLGHDLLTYVTSGHQLDLEPGQPLLRAGGGSPMSFSAPALEEESLVLDFGALHGFYRDTTRERITQMAPGLVLRCLGMAEVCQSWGGLLAGLSIDPQKRPWTYPGANQGSLVICLRIGLFADPDEFKREMDEYVRQVSRLAPLEGFDEAVMPGGIEARRERQYRESGIPVGERHQLRLERLAEELGLSVPW